MVSKRSKNGIKMKFIPLNMKEIRVSSDTATPTQLVYFPHRKFTKFI